MHEFTQFGEAGDPVEDTVTLDYEQRQKSRQRIELDGGVAAGILLRHGERPDSGAILRTRDGYCIQVVPALEALSVVYADDPYSLARASYHLGNRHVAVQIEKNSIRYARDHVLDDMIRGLGLHLAHEMATFEPEIGAYAKHAHGPENHAHAHRAAHGASEP